jgi:hypothetical protein
MYPIYSIISVNNSLLHVFWTLTIYLLMGKGQSVKNKSDKRHSKERLMSTHLIVSCYNRINSDSHRLVHLDKTDQMWSEVFQEHRQKFQDCPGFLSWDTATEERRGLVTKLGLLCETCVYKFKKYPLYREIDTKNC